MAACRAATALRGWRRARSAIGDAGQQQDRDEGERGERQHRNLPVRHDDKRRHQRPQRLAEIAADLEQALREAVPAARRRPRGARRLGVENRAADADQGDGDQTAHRNCAKASSTRPNSVKPIANGRARRPPVGEHARSAAAATTR